MKLIDVANKIDKSSENEVEVNINSLEDELGVDVSWLEPERVKSFWLGKWICSDTEVGHRLYFFDDKPVAISIQNYRRDEEHFFWFEEEDALKVREYLLSAGKEEKPFGVKVKSIYDNYGDGFRLRFSANIPEDNRGVSYNKQKVEIDEEFYKDRYSTNDIVVIKMLDDSSKEVNISELVFEFHLNN